MPTIAVFPPNRPLAAAGLMLGAALLIGLTDNFVALLARDTGLWQFHVLRSALALPVLALVARGTGQRFAPLRWPACCPAQRPDIERD